MSTIELQDVQNEALRALGAEPRKSTSELIFQLAEGWAEQGLDSHAIERNVAIAMTVIDVDHDCYTVREWAGDHYCCGVCARRLD